MQAVHLLPTALGCRNLLLAAVCLAMSGFGCGTLSASSSYRDQTVQLGHRDSLRLLAIGDTGLDNDAMRSLRAAIKAENKDLVIALGDLVYPEAPPCPSGQLTAEATALLDETVGATLLDLGAPVLLVLGNHDVRHGQRDPAREACILRYAERHPELIMPSLTWVLDVGVMSIVGLNTNALDDAQAMIAARALREAKGWTVIAGHHVLRTYHDKEEENVIRPWLDKHGLHPSVFLNAHAHLLQSGSYDGIIALTSGSAALPRNRPECPPSCEAGQRFGSSLSGYALLDVNTSRLKVGFYDNKGTLLHEEVHEGPVRPSHADPREAL
jgi:predicted phosphodiesterase